jgi:hypothetical protein
MKILFKLLLIAFLVFLFIGIPTALCYGVYLILVKLGAAKWVAFTVALAAWVLMGISANHKKY